MIVLATDPGLSTGYACIKMKEDRKIELVDMGVISGINSLVDLEPLLENADILVIEDFYVRPQDAAKLIYQELHAPEAIGALKAMAGKMEVEIQMQSPSLKPVGYGWAGLKYVKGKKNMHSQDALAHAVYYLVKHRKAIPLAR